jgi:hypothetical protein
MMQSATGHFLFDSVALLPTSRAAELCKPVGKRDRADVAREYGRDPAGVVQKATEVLHNQFKAHNLNEPNQIYKDNSDLRIQMSIMMNYFSLNHWVDKLSVITGDITKAQFALSARIGVCVL